MREVQLRALQGAEAVERDGAGGDRKAMARRWSISVATLNRAIYVRRRAEPEIIAAAYEGTITLSRARKLVALARPAQAAALREYRAAEPAQRSRSNRNPPRRPVGRRMTRALDQLNNAVDAVRTFTRERGATDCVDAPDWYATIAAARDLLTEVLRARRQHDHTDDHRDYHEVRPLQDRVAPDPGPRPAPEGPAPL